MAVTAVEDDDEEDELAKVPKHKKTKDGYLKDGFVVDNSDEEYESENSNNNSDEDEDDEETETTSKTKEEEDDDLVVEDIGSELSEESYDYDSDSGSDHKK